MRLDFAQLRGDVLKGSRLWQSLRRHFDAHPSVAILEWVTLAGLAVSALMAWLRYREGNQFQMALDIAIVVVLVVCYAAMAFGVRRATVARFAAVLTGLGVVMSAWVEPELGTHWVFVMFVVAFILFRYTTALAISLGALVVVAWRLWMAESTIDFIGFATAGLLVIGFNYLFARRENRHREDLHSIAMQDALTGLGNRRAFDRRVDHLMREARENGAALGMFMLDLDHFKTVNDRFGHAGGDQVLMSFARIIRHHTRSIDELFRMGGEEFVLLLPGMDAAHLASHGNALLDVIRADLKAGGTPVTSSIGASLWGANESVKIWMARTDKALYEAKAKGRDRIVVH